MATAAVLTRSNTKGFFQSLSGEGFRPAQSQEQPAQPPQPPQPPQQLPPWLIMKVAEVADSDTIRALLGLNRAARQVLTEYERSVVTRNLMNRYGVPRHTVETGVMLSCSCVGRRMIRVHTYEAVAEMDARKQRADFLLDGRWFLRRRIVPEGCKPPQAMPPAVRESLAAGVRHCDALADIQAQVLVEQDGEAQLRRVRWGRQHGFPALPGDVYQKVIKRQKDYIRGLDDEHFLDLFHLIGVAKEGWLVAYNYPAATRPAGRWSLCFDTPFAENSLRYGSFFLAWGVDAYERTSINIRFLDHGVSKAGREPALCPEPMFIKTMDRCMRSEMEKFKRLDSRAAATTIDKEDAFLSLDYTLMRRYWQCESALNALSEKKLGQEWDIANRCWYAQ